MRILLVRLRLIGDVVFTTPLIRALRRHHADAHLAYVVEPSAAPILRGNPHLNDVDRRAQTPRACAVCVDDLALARRLRRERFDIAIDLHGGPRAAWLTWASGAPMRIGYAIAGRSWMYTHRVRSIAGPVAAPFGASISGTCSRRSASAPARPSAIRSR